MSEPIPTYAQHAYAILYNRFGDRSFNSDYLGWFLSEGMIKKTLHVLERRGWIRRESKGVYVCVSPGEVFMEMVRFRVPKILEKTGRKYAYTRASAAEVWTDYSYIQRSWEHSPYFVKVLREDVDHWVRHFRDHKIAAFIEDAKPAMGEFVVLFPEEHFDHDVYNGKPVDGLGDVTRFCERHIEAFEYPLAYLKGKFGVGTRVEIDERVLEEAARVI